MTLGDITGGIDLVIKHLEQEVEKDPPFSQRRALINQKISELKDQKRDIERILREN